MSSELFPSKFSIEVMTCQKEVDKNELLGLIYKLDETSLSKGFETWEAYQINDRSYWVVYKNWP